MKTLRRFDFKNVYYFITVVTYRRKRILTDNLDISWRSWKEIELLAWVVLPDHFHAILDVGEYGRVWQNRFWDHIIRDQDDMNRHLDYIHFNPVKHGIVDDPFEYEYSSLNDFYRQGYYERNWRVGKEIHFNGEYGE